MANDHKNVGRPPIGALMKPIYVTQMGWHRMSRESRIKWLGLLRDACFATIAGCNRELARLKREGPR